jgi:type VI protein secretion system component VasK
VKLFSPRLVSLLMWLLLFFVVVFVFWNLSSPGTPFVDVLLSWLPALFFVVLIVLFMSYSMRDLTEARKKKEAHMENVARQLERIAEALEHLRKPSS